MSTPERTTSMESNPSEGNVRKRVCKACDRCRLKKSKCDGASPCSRCKTDNAICVFGERKKSLDKVYPKGYVEMLEQQQSQLVAGLRELYRRLQAGEKWSGGPLQEAHAGHPLTHDILERLDLLHVRSDGGYDSFEEDCSRMQRQLIENGAQFMQRRGSISSDSDQGPASSFGTPATQPLFFNESFGRSGAPPTPPNQSPFPRQSQIHAPFKHPQQFAIPPVIQTALDPATIMQSTWGMPTPTFDDDMKFMAQYDSPMSYDAPLGFNQYTSSPQVTMSDWTADPSDLDFSNFINQHGS